MATFITLKQLSELSGYTPRNLQLLVSEGVVKRNERGQYDLVESVKALISYLRKKALSKELLHIREGIAAEELRKRKRLNDEQEGKLIRTDIATSQVMAVFSKIIARLEAMPNNLAAILHTCSSVPEKAEEIRRYVYDMRIEISTPDFYRTAIAEAKTAIEKPKSKPKKAEAKHDKKRRNKNH